MHINKGKTIAQCLADRTDYAKNPDKTNEGELISSYGCDFRTVDAEFLFSKRQYKHFTGKEEKNNVIAYQVRQSFKPGEVSPEEANQIGYDFAARFLKGKHAFIVCTHTDKAHIHNHIIWNSTTLDCKRKFRDFLRSGKAVARLSDLICAEHQLSVIDNPQKGGCSYSHWKGFQGKPSHRETLRIAVDEALEQKPHDFEAFISLLEDAGYRVSQGKYLTFDHDTFKQKIRMHSLGDGYDEASIRAIIKGQKVHQPKKRRMVWESNRPQTIIDIQAKLAAGKGEGYRRWATVENLKRMAKTKLYMDEHGVSYEQMSERKTELSAKEKELTAKKAFDELGVKKLPTIKSLQVEFAQRLNEKKAAYAELKKVRDELRDLAVHTANYEELRDLEEREKRKETEHGRD